MELWTGALSWWKCHWPDLKSAGFFRPNLFLNSLRTSTLTLSLWPFSCGVLTSLLLPHLSSSLKDSLPSLNLLCHSKQMLDSCNMVKKQSEKFHTFLWHFSKFKQNFIAYSSSKVSDCIFEIRQLWQSGFSRVYSNCLRQFYMPIRKKSGNLSYAPRNFIVK